MYITAKITGVPVTTMTALKTQVGVELTAIFGTLAAGAQIQSVAITKPSGGSPLADVEAVIEVAYP
jgi:hypothetical protein